MKMIVSLTEVGAAAVFAEWDKRAAAGDWDKNPRDPDASAKLFVEIAAELFPDAVTGE